MDQANRLKDVINLTKYPVDDVNTQEFKTLLKQTRDTYEKDGIVTLHNFLSDEALEKSVAEMERAKGSEWFTKSTHNESKRGVCLKDLEGSFRYPLVREGVYAPGEPACLAHVSQIFINIVGLTALRLAFFMEYE